MRRGRRGRRSHRPDGLASGSALADGRDLQRVAGLAGRGNLIPGIGALAGEAHSRQPVQAGTVLQPRRAADGLAEDQAVQG